jgi:S1-C subfamily serine protease
MALRPPRPPEPSGQLTVNPDESDGFPASVASPLVKNRSLSILQENHSMQRFRQPFWLVTVFTLLWSAAASAADYPDFVTLVERYSPAVVSINTKSNPRKKIGPGTVIRQFLKTVRSSTTSRNSSIRCPN